MLKLIRKFVGTSNERHIKSLSPLIARIRSHENAQEPWADSDFSVHAKKLSADIANGRPHEDILPEVFAMVCHASRRTLNMRPFDVQLLGGMVLNEGDIAEMRTGEGKTLVATLPIVHQALKGKGAHVITVNDYLARRDSEWMGEIYRFMGLSVGCVYPGLDEAARRAAYRSDITYATNSEIGFDYLRDNLRFSLESMVQLPFHYGLVDEVDNILIDEARTPLIISGAVDSSKESYRAANALVAHLLPEDIEIDEKQRNLSLTDAGSSHVEDLLRQRGLLSSGSLFDLQNIHFLHYVQQAVKAHNLFKSDREYIVKNKEVILIDEFTGRMMEGRRLSDGLHQAIEAKEGVPINSENQTIASITYQNLFRLYPSLAGMTGTAQTEAAEFEDIYSLGVYSIPTHENMVRKDHEDEIYRSSTRRAEAVVEQVKVSHAKGQPILIGTVSIEKSEKLSKLLRKEKIQHNVLNARHHDREAEIIADAGCRGAVTIATNMAGRGTDIQLGGNVEMRLLKDVGDLDAQRSSEDKVATIKNAMKTEQEDVRSAGGLFVIGTERHESRRIDNQLRGRSGRQGDPGESRFFLSMDDDLMRIFGAERMESTLAKLGLKEDEALIHPWLSKAIERAQSRVEQMNFDIRKQLLRFDDVLNDQRKAIFSLRRDVMADESLEPAVQDMIEDVAHAKVSDVLGKEESSSSRNFDELEKDCFQNFNLRFPVDEWKKEDGISDEIMISQITGAIKNRIAEKEKSYGSDSMRKVEKHVVLSVIDQNWRQLLQQMEQLRKGIGLRAYGQRDPLNEYKREAIGLFEEGLANVKQQVVSLLCRFELSTNVPAMASPDSGADSKLSLRGVPRNAPCPCGSGQKFKHCHGKYR